MTNNFIIHASANQYQWSGECFLSVKSFYNGFGHYKVGGRSYSVDETSFLVLNECTNYQLTIDGQKETESFCVFFSPSYVSKFCADYMATDEDLLENRNRKESGFRFIEQKYQRSGGVSELLQLGRDLKICNSSNLEKDTFYQKLLTHLIGLNDESFGAVEKLSQKRQAIRIEIFERVACARDYLEANFREDLSLKQVAEVAMLSQNHLMRCFLQVFGISPFSYVSRLRVREAMRLLKQTNKSITVVAQEVGYSSMSNFSTYFKQITGFTPSQFKQGDL